VRDAALMVRSLRRCALATLLALGARGATGCNRARTQLVVRVDSDLSESALPNLRMRCAYSWNGTDPIEALTCDQPWHRGSSSAEITLPASFGVLGDDTRLAEPVTIVIDDTEGQLRRIARVQFVQGRALELDIFLSGACRASVIAAPSHPCPAGRTTCTQTESCEAAGLTCGNEGTCRSIDVAPAELVAPGEADAAARPDGAPDAASDAARDGGADATSDADAAARPDGADGGARG
jgi:hypothetical protein